MIMILKFLAYFCRFTIGNKAKPTPKYIPFWQRLMSTTSKPIEDEATEETELNTDAPEEVVEEASTQAEVLEKEVEETTPEESETTSIPEEDLVETLVFFLFFDDPFLKIETLFQAQKIVSIPIFLKDHRLEKANLFFEKSKFSSGMMCGNRTPS